MVKTLVAGTMPAIAGFALHGWARGGDVPAATQVVAKTQAAAAYHTSFKKGDPIGDYFDAMAVRFGLTIVVMDDGATRLPVAAPFDLPEKLEDAVAAGRGALDGQGYTLGIGTQGGTTVLRVTAKDTAPARAGAPAHAPAAGGGIAGRRG